MDDAVLIIGCGRSMLFEVYFDVFFGLFDLLLGFIFKY